MNLFFSVQFFWHQRIHTKSFILYCTIFCVFWKSCKQSFWWVLSKNICGIETNGIPYNTHLKSMHLVYIYISVQKSNPSIPPKKTYIENACQCIEKGLKDKTATCGKAQKSDRPCTNSLVFHFLNVTFLS